MSTRDFALFFGLILCASACAKKAPPKPLHTEPWLAHPPPSAGAVTANGDAAVATTKYVLSDKSRISLELSTRRGKVRGQLTRVTGELELALGALAQSHAEVRADLSSLTLEDERDADENGAAWLARARSALGLVDGGAGVAPATFELTGVSELSLEALSLPEGDGGARSNQRVRGVAEGNLLLNGFRVAKRAPLEAEFGFAGGGASPASVAIRSRAPLVVSLETHEIHLRDAPAHGSGAGGEKRRARAQSGTHDLHLTFELYATKP